MKGIKFSGATVEERLASAERIVERLSKRTVRGITLINPPIVITTRAFSIAENGTFYSFICPYDGEITELVLDIDWPFLEVGKLNVVVDREGSADGSRHSIEEGPAIFVTKTKVKKGDKIRFSITDVKLSKESDQFNCIWLSVSISINVKAYMIKEEPIVLEDSSEIVPL